MLNTNEQCYIDMVTNRIFWNPFGTHGFIGSSIISAKSLILVVSRTGFEPVTH